MRKKSIRNSEFVCFSPSPHLSSSHAYFRGRMEVTKVRRKEMQIKKNLEVFLVIITADKEKM
jgi:hypothetical protein